MREQESPMERFEAGAGIEVSEEGLFREIRDTLVSISVRKGTGEPK